MEIICLYSYLIECINYGALTLRAAQSRVTNARVLVVSKVEKGTTIISIQKDALVNHSFNNVCVKVQIRDIIIIEAEGRL